MSAEGSFLNPRESSDLVLYWSFLPQIQRLRKPQTPFKNPTLFILGGIPDRGEELWNPSTLTQHPERGNKEEAAPADALQERKESLLSKPVNPVKVDRGKYKKSFPILMQYFRLSFLFRPTRWSSRQLRLRLLFHTPELALQLLITGGETRPGTRKFFTPTAECSPRQPLPTPRALICALFTLMFTVFYLEC